MFEYETIRVLLRRHLPFPHRSLNINRSLILLLCFNISMHLIHQSYPYHQHHLCYLYELGAESDVNNVTVFSQNRSLYVSMFFEVCCTCTHTIARACKHTHLSCSPPTPLVSQISPAVDKRYHRKFGCGSAAPSDLVATLFYTCFYLMPQCVQSERCDASTCMNAFFRSILMHIHVCILSVAHTCMHSLCLCEHCDTHTYMHAFRLS